MLKQLIGGIIVADNAKFDVNRINAIKDKIISSIKIQGIDAIDNNCQHISSVLSTKNEEMAFVYSSFEAMQEVMNNIAEMMNEDPETGADNGNAYTKRM